MKLGCVRVAPWGQKRATPGVCAHRRWRGQDVCGSREWRVHRGSPSTRSGPQNCADGDTVMVPSMDRLTRNLSDLLALVSTLTETHQTIYR
ncbi:MULTISPECIES: recombinase family protein [Gordonia]|uniref:recombinase family protein n=1 Tax=Gordonia TaxID=2053 RepID=UPI0009F96ADC